MKQLRRSLKILIHYWWNPDIIAYNLCKFMLIYANFVLQNVVHAAGRKRWNYSAAAILLPEDRYRRYSTTPSWIGRWWPSELRGSSARRLPSSGRFRPLPTTGSASGSQRRPNGKEWTASRRISATPAPVRITWQRCTFRSPATSKPEAASSSSWAGSDLATLCSGALPDSKNGNTGSVKPTPKDRPNAASNPEKQKNPLPLPDCLSPPPLFFKLPVCLRSSDRKPDAVNSTSANRN